MNCITSTHAICLFPRSTLVLRQSMISRQNAIHSNYTTEGQTQWFDRYSRGNSIKKIGFSCTPLRGREKGPRRIGDSVCWTLPCKPLRKIFPEHPMVRIHIIPISSFGKIESLQRTHVWGSRLDLLYMLGGVLYQNCRANGLEVRTRPLDPMNLWLRIELTKY